MGINPISELAALYQGQPQSGVSLDNSAGKTGTDSFQDFMKSATQSLSGVGSVRTEDGAQSSDSYNDEYMENLPTASDKYKADRKNSDNYSTENNNKSDSLSNNHKEVKKEGAIQKNNDKASSELKDKIVDEAAKTLGISVEELNDLLAQLGIGAADLLNPENISLLVSEVRGDGDMMALITDENLGTLVNELNNLMADIVEDVAQINELTADDLKAFILDESNQGTSEDIDKQVISQTEDLPVIDENIKAQPASDNKENITDNLNISDTVDDKTSSLKATDVKENESGSSKGHENEHKDSNLSGTESVSQMFDSQQPVNAEQVFNVNESAEILNTVREQQDIINQIQEHIKLQFKNDMTQLSMQLNPETLGTVNLNVTSKDGIVSAHLVAQNESVQAALEAQIAIVKESLEAQGVKIEAIEVTVASHEFEQNLEQGNDSNEQQEKMSEELRKATRKISINGEITDEMIDELDEDQIVTARMMKADGNSMDYKV